MKKIINNFLTIVLIAGVISFGCIVGYTRFILKEIENPVYEVPEYDGGDGFFGNKKVDAIINNYSDKFRFHSFYDKKGVLIPGTGVVGGNPDFGKDRTKSTLTATICIPYFPDFSELVEINGVSVPRYSLYEDIIFGKGYDVEGEARIDFYLLEEFLETIVKYEDRVSIGFSQNPSNAGIWFQLREPKDLGGGVVLKNDRFSGVPLYMSTVKNSPESVITLEKIEMINYWMSI